MSSPADDHGAGAPGFDRRITRRDFLNGVAVPVAGALAGVGAGSARAAGDTGAGGDVGEAPPGDAIARLAGQSLQAAAAMHARRDGAPRPQPPAWGEGDERVDLVVVGAGISGLAAAWWWRRQRPDARILLLDALPTVGGHAQRNEFVASNGRRFIGYGGSEAMDSPGLWSPAARALVAGVGIDLAQFRDWYDHGFGKRHGLERRAMYFAPEAWPDVPPGASRLVLRGPDETNADWAPRLPLPEDVRHEVLALLDGPADPFPTLTRSQKRERLAAMTYEQLVTGVFGYSRACARVFNERTRGYFGVGADATSALDASTLGLPGFSRMKLGDAPDRLMSPSGRQLQASTDEYINHFPDGNHGLVRAIVRQLVPDALPGSGMESLVLATLDESALDRPGTPCRIRTSSPVVDVRHAGEPAHAAFVDVTWQAPDGSLRVVRADHVVMACFHRAIPFLCPELPEAQVAALDDQVKVPLVYGSVLVRDWRAFASAGIEGFSLPGHPLWEEIRLDMPVSVGRYRFPDSPDEPMLLHLSATVLDGPKGSPEREQCAAGRRKLYGMDFMEVERGIRRLLDGALGAFGFDAAADIEAITLNRWAHGYAYEYMRPWDTFWPDGPLPIETARRGWGRIAIANADAGAYAYAHGAIDQATRAVGELLPHARLPAWWKTPGPSPKQLKLPARPMRRS